jgi:hypothetical protein
MRQPELFGAAISNACIRENGHELVPRWWRRGGACACSVDEVQGRNKDVESVRPKSNPTEGSGGKRFCDADGPERAPPRKLRYY